MIDTAFNRSGRLRPVRHGPLVVRSTRLCGLVRNRRNKADVGVRNRWAVCCMFLCIVSLNGCRRPTESISPTMTSTDRGAPTPRRVAGPISKERAVEIAEAETRRMLEGRGIPVPEVIETSAKEDSLEDGWVVVCDYDPGYLDGAFLLLVFPDGSVFESEEWHRRKWESMSAEERRKRLEWVRGGPRRDAEDE